MGEAVTLPHKPLLGQASSGPVQDCRGLCAGVAGELHTTPHVRYYAQVCATCHSQRYRFAHSFDVLAKVDFIMGCTLVAPADVLFRSLLAAAFSAMLLPLHLL